MAGFGETLRQARAHKNVSLKEAEQSTRITRHYLAALEEEDFSSLPPIIYQRGFVRNYSIYLDLDPAQTLALFEEAHGTTGQEKVQGVTAVPPIDMPNHWAPNFAIIAFSVVLSAIVFAWIYTAYVAPPGDNNEATPPVATVTPINNDVALPTQPRATETPVPTATVEATATSEATQQATTDTAENNANRRTSGGDNTIEGATDQSGGDASTSEAPVSGDNSRNSDNQPEPTATIEATAEPTAYVKVGENDTSISVSADVDIYVTFYSNGNLEYDGTLDAGDSIGPFPGSTFEVYTSSGANTEFTNSCGDVFRMGDQQGEITYELNASPDSCPPNFGQ